MSYRPLALLSILLALFLATPTIAAVPATLSLITATSATPQVPNTDPTYKCRKRGFFRSQKRPSFAECYRAIRALPQLFETGTFHNGGWNNRYRLPVTESFGRCRAHVDLAQGKGRVVSSWGAVTSALDHLSILCRRDSSLGEWTGGWMLMGPEPGLKVSLLAPDDDIELDNVGGLLVNGTVNGTLFE